MAVEKGKLNAFYLIIFIIIIIAIKETSGIYKYIIKCIIYIGFIIDDYQIKSSDNLTDLLLKCPKGVAVCKELSFIVKCDDQQQMFQLSDYGIKLIIPPSAVPHDIQQITIAVQVIASSPFDFPSHCHPISCFYWIQSTHKFLKPVEVHLEHHAELLSEEDSQELGFIVSPSTESSSPPYRFQFSDGVNSIFPVGSIYGIIKVAEFSIFSIAWKRIRAAFSDHFRYVWMVYYRQSHENNWELHVVVTKDLGPFLQVH